MALPKQKASKGTSSKPSSSSEFNSTDPRFARLQTDPRFKLPSRKHTHTKLDSRFSRILKNDDFSKKASVDRYGRKLDKSAGRKELERLYSLEDEDEDEDESSDDEDEVRKELKRAGREAGTSGSSDDESEEEESDDDEELEVVELDEEVEDVDEEGQAVPMGEVSSRIAAVNMDWDNIRAVDLMAVAASFAPPSGRILSVTVYPSEFGRERMEREELEGPPKELFASSKPKSMEEDSDSESEEDSEEEDERIKNDLLQEDKGDEFNSTALRAYQLDRLKYYYAILHCSSEIVAKKLYDDMDGREYLSSANFFDLRFVPDEVTFGEKPRDVCKEVPRDYRPTEFVTEALTHSNVKLTWDADDKQRKEVQKRAFSRKEIDENDLQAYIGSASSSDAESDQEIFSEEEETPNGDTISVTSKSTVNKQAKRDALRAALGLPSEAPISSGRSSKKDKAAVGNMQISFTPGLSISTKASVFENDPREIEESTLETYVRKERERKARRKERAKARREGRDPNLVGVSDEEADPVPEAEVEEVGFDDPFFTDPLNADRDSKKARKAEKARLRAEKAADDTASATKREELELLMAGEDDTVRHFDMRDIKKQEKALKLKSKKKKNKKIEVDEGQNGKEEGGFEMDTQDPRFERLFESHEFAIDPTNPRFKKTEGMKALIEEGRKKRARGVEGEERKGKKVKTGDEKEGEELSRLVEKVKKKAKA